MADLRVNFAGIRSPNPFWLASAPPTNTGEQVMRAFDAGWGGAVWKTIGTPVVNTCSRYSSIDWQGRRMVGLNNIELISDRPLELNLREIAEVKKRYPANAVIASLMVESTREAWHTIVAQAEDAGADALELNFGCPHGMSERGMGAAVGQVPDYTRMITAWVKERARTPVIVKLTPNVTDIRVLARAAREGGADAVSAINTINSITGIDLNTLIPRPNVDGLSTHGGYCGPAVKPIALNMVEQCAAEGLAVCGIGGISGWQDAAEFMLLGAGAVQVCTAVMHYGYRIVEDMIDGLAGWMRGKGFATVDDFRGLSLPRMVPWENLNLNYKTVAHIDESKCIGCALCYIACWDGAHQCIHLDRVTGPVNGPVELHPRPADLTAATNARISTTPIPRLDAAIMPGSASPGSAGPENAGSPNGNPDHATPLARIPRVDETECVGCNLCSLVCPVDDCITMVELPTAKPPETWAQRTGAAECAPPPRP